MRKIFLPKKIPSEAIRYVEHQEGMKFKRKPTLGVYRGDDDASKNIVKRERQGNKVLRVVSARVELHPAVLASNKKALTKAGKTTLLHELRENLYYQNIGRISDKRAHKLAQVKWRKDSQAKFKTF
jgi:hypothetical protein